MKFKPVSDSSVRVSSVSLEELVVSTHPYRKLLSIIDFAFLCRPLHDLYSDFGRPAYRVEQGFCALVLQWMEDLSDRELERYLQENIAGKYFCGFGLLDKTPDHTYFCDLRKRIGASGLGKLFTLLGKKLKEQGLVCEIFNFVDASQMISKVALWEERDRAIAQGIEKLNNEVVHQFASDSQARFGCKGKKKYWFGYKRHLCVCMKQGFITKTAATPANVTDAQGLKHVCPKGGMTVADKAYAVHEAQQTLKKNGCHSGAILKDNMRDKDRKKDAFLTKIRMPFENVFSKMDKKVRYRGQAKVQLQAFMQAFAFNFKRLITLNAPPLFETSTG